MYILDMFFLDGMNNEQRYNYVKPKHVALIDLVK